MYSLVVMKSFHWATPWKRAMVANAGLESGRMIEEKTRSSPAPSILAESINEFGTCRKKFIRMITS